jgi:small subunit ribosomal protein S7
MSRRAAAPHRTILPDPKFGNDMLAKFINMVMERGKKSAAEKIVYGAIDRIGEAATARSEKSMAHRLAAELMEAAENRGAAVRKREDTHRMAEANKAFAHYRW